VAWPAATSQADDEAGRWAQLTLAQHSGLPTYLNRERCVVK
jgi:hypothetical protein